MCSILGMPQNGGNDDDIHVEALVKSLNFCKALESMARDIKNALANGYVSTRIISSLRLPSFSSSSSLAI